MGDHTYNATGKIIFYDSVGASSAEIFIDNTTTTNANGWYADNTNLPYSATVDIPTITSGEWQLMERYTVLNTEIRMSPEGIVELVLGNGQTISLGKGKVLKRKDGKIAIQIDSCDVRISEEELDRLSKEREKAHTKNNMMRRIFE